MPLLTSSLLAHPVRQDLSVAGLRKGMLHSDLGDEETTRSGLFMDAVRIIKEMRASEIRNGRSGVDVRPRYAVYENVPGAFSSNGGKDFQTVLTELIRIVEPTAPVVPLPEKGGWPHAGVFYGDMGGWTVASRLHDAQHHGVPQRRKRLAVVCDFNGLSAPEILFDPQLRGETESSEADKAVGHPGEQPRSEVYAVGKGVSRHSEHSGTPWEGTSESAIGCSDGTGKGSIGADKQSLPKAFGISPYDSGGMKSDNPKVGFYSAETTRTIDPSGGNPSCLQGGTAVVGYAVDCRNGTEDPFVNGTLQSKEQGQNLNSNNVVRVPANKEYEQ